MSNGIDVILDQWDLRPGNDLASFMENHVVNSDYLLIICTEEYVKKANTGIGGVGYEKMIITSDLIKKIDDKRIIPIIRQSGDHNVPTFLKTKLFINFSHDGNFESNYDDLVRAIHKSPLYEKPLIGKNPFNQPENVAPKKSNNALIELMTIVVNKYQSREEDILISELSYKLGISRIMLELLIKEAFEKDLITNGYYIGSITLSEKGKFYARENNLVK